MKPRVTVELAGERPRRGWFIERTSGNFHAVHVKKGYHTEECRGQAHTNPHIDSCMLCLNHTWGRVAIKDTD